MKYLIGAILLLAGTGCTRIVFNTPQPIDSQALEAFPSKFRGTYISDDTPPDTLRITASEARMTELTHVTLGERALKTHNTLSIREDRIYDSERPELGGLAYTREDTLIRYAYASDPLRYVISDSFVVKQMGKCLVLSFQEADDEWEVWDVAILRIDAQQRLDLMMAANLKTPDSDDQGEYDGDIADYAKITPYQRLDEDLYLFSPTQKQFKRLVRKRLFRPGDARFIKLD